ncbi:MAG: hypothetical protein ACSHX0_14005 [Akkermansiaceae bacterium]
MKNEDGIPLRVLIYLDSDEWVAHVLEFDVVGVGSTPEEAQEQMMGAVDCHVSFCLQEGMELMTPAPKRLFDIWDAVQERKLSQRPKTSPRNYQLSTLPYKRRDDQTVRNQFCIA